MIGLAAPVVVFVTPPFDDAQLTEKLVIESTACSPDIYESVNCAARLDSRARSSNRASGVDSYAQEFPHALDAPAGAAATQSWAGWFGGSTWKIVR